MVMRQRPWAHHHQQHHYGEDGAASTVSTSSSAWSTKVEGPTTTTTTRIPAHAVEDRAYGAYVSGQNQRLGSSRDAGWCGGAITPDKTAKFCAGYSLVAILFLLFAGTLIEVQPLYIKGIKPKRIMTDSSSYTQQQQQQKQQRVTEHHESEAPAYARRRRSFPESKLTKENPNLRLGSKYKRTQTTTPNSTNRARWKLHTESANAYKAAAAYFVTLVFSLLSMDCSWTLRFRAGNYMRSMYQLASLRFSFLRKLRRRHYRDIPDSAALPMTWHDTAMATAVVPPANNRSTTLPDGKFEMFRRVGRVSKSFRNKLSPTAPKPGHINGGKTD